MQKFIQRGIEYIENELVCDECGNPVEFAGVPEDMYLNHRQVDSFRDDHSPFIDSTDLLVCAREALDEGEIGIMHDCIRAYVVLESMTKDRHVAIGVYKRALREISEI